MDELLYKLSRYISQWGEIFRPNVYTKKQYGECLELTSKSYKLDQSEIALKVMKGWFYENYFMTGIAMMTVHTQTEIENDEINRFFNNAILITRDHNIYKKLCDDKERSSRTNELINLLRKIGKTGSYNDLVYACEKECFDIVELLIDTGTKVSAEAIRIARSKNNADLVQLLLENKN